MIMSAPREVGGGHEVDGVEIARIENQTSKFKVHDFTRTKPPERVF